MTKIFSYFVISFFVIISFALHAAAQEQWHDCQLLSTIGEGDRTQVIHSLWINNNQRDLLLIQNFVYSCPCSDAARLAGNADDSRISGKNDSAKIAGNADASRAGGNDDSARLAGKTDVSRVGGNDESARLAGKADASRVGGNDDSSRLAGNGDSSRIGGGGITAKLGGNNDANRIAGNDDSARLSGGVDGARIGATAAAPACKSANSKSGYIIRFYTSAIIWIYDGIHLKQIND